MRPFSTAVLLAAIAAVATFALQRGGLGQPASNVRITAPENGQKITTDFVDLHYQLVNPGAAASPSPTFQVQLDDSSPVQTTSTDYTFTGLKPGPHTIVIELVDANGTPIPGSVNTVKFVVLPPATPKGAEVITGPPGAAPLRVAALGQERAAPAEKNALPDAGGALPLLSVIGFGVLLGGIASALKTR